MSTDKKNIILKGNKKLEEKLKKMVKRKDQIKKLIQEGASAEQIRKVAPLH